MLKGIWWVFLKTGMASSAALRPALGSKQHTHMLSAFNLSTPRVRLSPAIGEHFRNKTTNETLWTSNHHIKIQRLG